MSVYPLEYSHRSDWVNQLVKLTKKHCVHPGFSKALSCMVAYTVSSPSMMQLFWLSLFIISALTAVTEIKQMAQLVVIPGRVLPSPVTKRCGTPKQSESYGSNTSLRLTPEFWSSTDFSIQVKIKELVLHQGLLTQTAAGNLADLSTDLGMFC